jgi:hypothetical protein
MLTRERVYARVVTFASSSWKWHTAAAAVGSICS